MANYFVDSTTGSDSDNGLTMDTAWESFAYAVTTGASTAGDIIWVRRVHSEPTPTTHIDLAYDGTVDNPLIYSGWPRNSLSITSATWTNSSTTVDSISPSGMTLRKNCGRYITGPDGYVYLITQITDGDTFVIDRGYGGNTVSGVDGAATIHADENYNTAQSIDDSGWTIKVSNWNSDTDNIAAIDLGGTPWAIRSSGDYYNRFQNLLFRNSTSTGGIILPASIVMQFIGCIVDGTGNNYYCVFTNSGGAHNYWKRFIMFGSNNYGYRTYGNVHLVDGAIYDVSGTGVLLNYPGISYLENINLGVEESCDTDLYGVGHNVFGRDVKFGGSVSEAGIQYTLPHQKISIENYNKVLGQHKVWNGHGTITKTDVVAGSGDPEKRGNGSDSVIKLKYDENDTILNNTNAIQELTSPVFTHEFETATNSKTYRYYVQTDTETVSASQIWLEAEYTASYSSSGAYNITKVQSDEDITVRTGADDWSQYLEVENIQPAVSSKVRIKCYCRYYHATAKIWIDPKVEIL